MNFDNVKLREISTKITKGTTPTTLDRDFISKGVNFIKAEALNGDPGLIASSFAFIDEETNQLLKRSILEENDILVTIAGINVGKCGIVKKKHLPANTNQAVAIIRPDSHKVIPYFLYYSLKTSSMFERMQKANGQAAQPNINLETLGNLEIAIPSLSDQKNIASLLSSYDDLIEANERRIKILEEILQRHYTEWIISFKFPGCEKVNMTDSGAEYGLIPDGWKIGSLGDIAQLIKTKYNENTDVGYPLVDMARINSRNLAITNTGSPLELRTSRILFKKGDILFGSIRAYLHKVALAPFDGVTNISVFVIRPKYDNLKAFLSTLLFLERTVLWVSHHSSGTKMPTIKWDLFKRMPVIIPDNQILDKFQSMFGGYVSQIQELSKVNRNLSEMRALLIPRLVKGGVELN